MWAIYFFCPGHWCDRTWQIKINFCNLCPQQLFCHYVLYSRYTVRKHDCIVRGANDSEIGIRSEILNWHCNKWLFHSFQLICSLISSSSKSKNTFLVKAEMDCFILKFFLYKKIHIDHFTWFFLLQDSHRLRKLWKLCSIEGSTLDWIIRH